MPDASFPEIIVREVIAKDGDTLDALCWKHYGLEHAVPEVLAANPHLSRTSAALAAGTRVVLPAVATPQTVQAVRLWD